MATLFPFRALRPRPDLAAAIAAVPYDVVNTEEARTLAEGNPLSFLRVSRAEIELPADTDPYADAVYERAAQNYRSLTGSSFVLEDEASVYFYRLRTERDHVTRAIVFLVAARPLVLLDDVSVVLVYREAGGNTRLLVRAHAQAVEVHARFIFQHER